MIDEQSPALRQRFTASFTAPAVVDGTNRLEPWEVWSTITLHDRVDNCVLQDWVIHLPRRFQGALVVALRGCDLTRKPFDKRQRCPERDLTAYLRFLVLNPADPREVDVPGAFFASHPPAYHWKASEFGHYPEHWYSHLMHAFQVVGYEHPQELSHRNWAHDIYLTFVHNLHLRPEGRRDMWQRLCEDRLANDTVVS